MDNNKITEMGFLDHLEEFRWRIIKSIAAIVVGAIISFIFIDKIMELLVAPTLKIGAQFTLQVLKVQGMFMVKWGLAFVGGFILGLPIITYQLWKFAAPGLYGSEIKFILPIIIFTYIAFLCGILFAYFVLIPFSLHLLQYFALLSQPLLPRLFDPLKPPTPQPESQPKVVGNQK